MNDEVSDYEITRIIMVIDFVFYGNVPVSAPRFFFVTYATPYF